MLRQKTIGLAIKVYRHTPLYPRCGAAFASILARVQKSDLSTPSEHTVGGFKMCLYRDQVIDSQLYYTGSFEPDAEQTIEKLVGKDDVAIDIGANIGYLTLHLARQVGKGGRVFAFEPIDETFRRLTTNVGLNDLPQVTPVQSGVSDTVAQDVPVEIESSYRLDGKSEPHKQTIRVTTIDDFVEGQGLDRLDFLKIDTDGMEMRILRGAQKSIERFGPSILTECGPEDLRQAGSSAGEMIDLLEAWGYQFYHPGSLAPDNNLRARLQKLHEGTSLNLVARSKTRAAAPAKETQAAHG